MYLINNDEKYLKIQRRMRGNGRLMTVTADKTQATDIVTNEIFDLLEWLHNTSPDKEWRATD